MSHVVITEFMDEAAVREHLGGFDVVLDPNLVDQPEKLRSLLGDCRALIVRNRTQVRGALLQAAPLLRVVGRLGVGLDNIDVAACAARDVRVCPATGANDLAVAEYVVCAAMLLLRRAWFATAAVAAGKWPRMELIGQELAGKRLGLVGFGAIARLTARKALALGMRVAAHDPFVAPTDDAWHGIERLELTPLLATSDVVSLHTPLTTQTRHLIDASAIAQMRRGSVLINAARGGVLDESALIAALHAR
ncbi:MAG: 3-phosphoglycerate dehydrogenase, partial [Gammaproteobacteria bacterium]|nr:3-phosphoglycerate dehydrogenase [Gammaproteobacteria bacterium]